MSRPSTFAAGPRLVAFVAHLSILERPPAGLGLVGSAPSMKLTALRHGLAVSFLAACTLACEGPRTAVEEIFSQPVLVTAPPTPLPDLDTAREGYSHPSLENADGSFTRILWLPVGLGASLQTALTGQPDWDAVKPVVSNGRVLNDLNAPNNTVVKAWADKAGTETLTLRGALDQIDRCTDLIEYFLASVPQILIEARVVEVIETDEFGFGIDWFALDVEDHPGPYSSTGARRSGNLNPSSSAFDRVNAGGGIPPLPGVIRGAVIPNVLLELGTVFDNVQVDALISALSQFTKVDVVNAPTVRVRTGHVAQILSGQDVPLFSVNVSGNSTTVTTQFREVGVKLNILPALLTPQLIQLSVDLRVENVTGIQTVSSGDAATSNPIISSRSVTTTMSVKNGSTVVLGGLITTQNFEVQDKVPVLGDVPVLGVLFTNRNREKARSNLLFFLRPTLMPNPLDRRDKLIEPPSDAAPTGGDLNGQNGR